jgi:hypothetical protein
VEQAGVGLSIVRDGVKMDIGPPGGMIRRPATADHRLT